MTLAYWLAAGCLLVVGVTAARADDAAKGKGKGFVEKTYKGEDGESKYVVFVPHGHKPGKASPIILFLHGMGESEGGTKMPVEVGIGTYIKTVEKTFPFVVVIPQSKKRTWQADSADGKRAMAMLEATEKEYGTDPKRVYLTGLSMGGYGTWSLAAKYPERWAAIAPICGGGDVKSAAKIKDLPCWCFHGGADKVVVPKRSQEMIDALKAAGGKPQYTEYPGVTHNSWDKAYGTKELYDWLLEHKLK